MTPVQITQVQKTFGLVAPNAPEVAALFYQRLFEINPSLRPMFPPDLRDQGIKLMGMLRTVVNGLSSPETIIPAAQALAKRHVQYGVKDEHYATVGTALLDTLRTGLGTAFTPDVEQSWAAAYSLLSQVMIEATH